MGLVVAGGCLIISGGCLQQAPPDQNTDPCAGPCCQFLIANLITRLSSGATWSDDGTYYTVNMNDAFTNIDQFTDCPGMPITLDSGGLWEWAFTGFAYAYGTLTTTAANLQCPPIDHNGTGWAWVNDSGSMVPIPGGDPTLRLMTMDCNQSEALALPDTGSTLSVAGIIADFTTSGLTTVSPTYPVWDGSLAWSVADNRWEVPNADPSTGLNSVACYNSLGNARYIDVVIYMEASISFSGYSVLQLNCGEIGVFFRLGGHWYDPIGVGQNAKTSKGRMYVTLGVAP